MGEKLSQEKLLERLGSMLDCVIADIDGEFPDCESVRELKEDMYQAYSQIKAMIQQPQRKVGRDFVEKWAEIYRNLRSAVGVFNDYRVSVRTMLKELGIEITED